DALVWSVALAAFGSAVIWTRSDDAGRARWTRLATRLQRGPVEAIALGRVTRWRLAMGTLLVIGGMSTFLAYHYSLGSLRNAAFAVFVAVAGLALILGPWTYQLARQLGDERRERIRSEAMANAARHSGARRISVYVEVAPDAVSAFVRDEGSGFDSARLPQDRRGIAESIVGRMERHGGVATVTSEPSEGTEVSLRMPWRAG